MEWVADFGLERAVGFRVERVAGFVRNRWQGLDRNGWWYWGGIRTFDMGLTDASGWCPVDRRTFESSVHKDVFVIGDASIADAMPKSGFSANTQAKVTARAVADQLAGRAPGEPVWENTCYALAGSDYGLFVADVFRLRDGKIAQVSGQRYLPLDATPAQIRLAAAYQQAWLKTFTEDCFA